ncbi:MAG: acetyl-CoA carboxylase, carboxyltransferase subunit beta [Alphaproteobacteria bacterium]|nr:acetyl-CoA carboxylase, carboxyltransferase subunit beta [Alphaproteobacteria bacterium]
MSWLNNYVRPKIRALVARRNVPDNLWDKCPSCEQMIFHRDLESQLFVCPHCEHHMAIGSEGRFAALFDEGEYTAIDLPEVLLDPLRFRDTKRYADRLKDAQAKSGHQDAISVVHGAVGGRQLVAAAFNFGFMGGSMGMAVGEGLVSAAKLAVLQRAPLVVFPASGGARMQEGILSLMQMPRTTIAVNEVREAGLPYIVVLTNPTTGGVTASFAMLGDITLAEPGALIGFAGPRVIESTLHQSLPEGFQKSEYLLEHGMVDAVVHRREIRDTLIRLTSLLMAPLPGADVVDLVERSVAIPELGESASEAEILPPEPDEDEAPLAEK